MRGNVIDMAVGIVIGAAFGTIVNSVITDMIMPVIGMAGKADFSNLFVPLNGEVAKFAEANPNAGLADVRKVGPVLAYGSFITSVINFLILAFGVFLVVKAVNSLKRKQIEAPSVPPAPTKDQVLLTEIRDLLAVRR
jgi:large conductance mechanosensitive channel